MIPLIISGQTGENPVDGVGKELWVSESKQTDWEVVRVRSEVIPSTPTQHKQRKDMRGVIKYYPIPISTSIVVSSNM